MSDVKALIAEARNETACICPDILDGPAISCGDHGDQHSRLFGAVIDALEASVQAPAVDREALAQVLLNSVPLTPSNRNVVFHQVEEVIASGILQDAAEVEARGLEKAADEWLVPGAMVPNVKRWLRARAQQVREGNA